MIARVMLFDKREHRARQSDNGCDDLSTVQLQTVFFGARAPTPLEVSQRTESVLLLPSETHPLPPFLT